MWSVRDVLESKSLAVIGASRDPQKSGSQLLKVLKKVGFSGQVAGVNPQGGEVFETPFYRTIGEIPFKTVYLHGLIRSPAGTDRDRRLGKRR